MTNWAPIGLMAAAMFLAVQGQPRSDQHLSDQDLLAGRTPVICPCGDPHDKVPLGDWDGIVECSFNPGRRGGDTLLQARANFRTLKAGEVSLSASLSGVLGGFCSYMDAQGVLLEGAPKSGLSVSELNECSSGIISYAQALQDADKVDIEDIGCELE